MISKRKNTQWAAVLWEKRSSWSQWSEERGQVASRWQEDNINSKNHWLQLRYAEEHLLMHNMPNLEADGYSNRRQNMVQEQETKAAIKTKIGQKIEKKKHCLRWWICFSAATFRQQGQNFVSESCCWWCKEKNIFLAHFGPHRTNWESFKHHSRHPAFSSWWLHLTKLTSS